MPMPASSAATGVAADLPCIACGYNLRSMAPSGACPECGLAVARTLQSSMRLSDPRWLRTLARGAAWIAVAFVTSILTDGLVAWFHHTPHAVMHPTDFAIPIWGGLLTICIWTVGVLLITAPERGDREPPADRRARRFLRYSPTLTVLLCAATLVLAFGLVDTMEIFGLALLVFAASIALFAWLGPLALCVTLHSLFRRLGAPGPARQARGLLGLVAAGVVVQGVLWVDDLVTLLMDFRVVSVRPAPGLGAKHMHEGLFLFALLALPLAKLWAVALLLALRRRLRQVARDAESIEG